MIEIISINSFSGELTVKPQGIGGEPIYLYIFPNHENIIYSKNVKDIFEHKLVAGSMEVCSVGLSHLLQDGVVPPPNCIYQNLYLLGIGDKAHITKINNKLNLRLKHEFIYTQQYLLEQKNNEFDLASLLEKVADSISKKYIKSKKINLFHTAGKDSNIIALALKEHFNKDQVRLVCHQSEGNTDESEISRNIADKLGFEHLTINTHLKLDQNYKDTLLEYFSESPFPLLDNVTLAFPEYINRFPDLHSSNIIIGDGNDTYMMSPPSLRDEMGILLNKNVDLGFIQNLVPSEHYLQQLTRTPYEWARMSGFSGLESLQIFGKSTSTRDYWGSFFKQYSSSSPLDIKSHSYACFIIYEVYIRKFRHYSDFISSQLIMPFFDEAVSKEICNLKTELIIDPKNRRNKPIFREIIKERLGIDADTLGKKGYTLNIDSFVVGNQLWITDQIIQCESWSPDKLNIILNRLYARTKNRSWTSSSAVRLIYRLLLVSLWLNNSKYIK